MVMVRAAFLGGLLALAPLGVRADAQAPAPLVAAGSDTIRYKVRPGDTLARIATFLTGADAAGTVRTVNHLPSAGTLAPGTILAIPFALLRTEALTARVTSFRGDVTIGRQGPVRVGMVFGEGIRVATGANSAVSFRLADGTAVTLPSLSTIRTVRLRRILLTNRNERVIALETGRTESQVTPSRDGSTAFEIRTPVSVAAVRGTDFRVAFSDEDRAATAGVLKGAVGVEGKDGSIALSPGFGARSDYASTGKPIALLAPPEILSPVGHRADGTLVFSFKKLDAAIAYRLVLAGDPDFHDLRSEITTRTAQAIVPPLPDGTYYIRATAIDPNGLEGMPVDYPYDHRIGDAAGRAAPRSGG